MLLKGPVAAMIADVQAGRQSAVTLATAALQRAAEYDRIQPQAWIERFPDATVLARASAVDAALAGGARLALAGVTFAVKDNIDVAGLPTTAACPAFAYRPAASASVVARLEAAGAIVLGKTNLDQFATGLVGTRSPHGVPACVFNRDYVSGGSSSGSAVVVGAGVVPFALGTDTAGSGRVPAAINGLVGYKPTKGRWSTAGVVPACRSLDCVSVFTHTSSDAALIDAVCAGPDPSDIYSRTAPVAGPLAGAGLRCAIPRPDQLQFLGDAESAALFAQATARLVAAGAELVTVDIAPLSAAAQLLYSGPWVAERSVALEEMLARQPAAIHPVVRGIVEGGRRIAGTDTFRGLYALQGYLQQCAALYRDVDALFLPTAPTTYRIAEVLAEPLALNSNLGLYTNFVNLLDLCAIAVPAGYRRNGTGFGVSLIAPAWHDSALFGFASRFEASGPQLQTPPLDTGPAAHGIQLAVVGAHLSGMPLHWQLTSRGARPVAVTRTAAAYRLFAMAGTNPPKPALVRDDTTGAAIDVEVYELSAAAFGSFVAEVPPPLAIGTVTLADGSSVKGFVAEPRATAGATEITAWGSWRAWLASRT
jgi:allophanate hydrolase